MLVLWGVCSVCALGTAEGGGQDDVDGPWRGEA